MLPLFSHQIGLIPNCYVYNIKLTIKYSKLLIILQESIIGVDMPKATLKIEVSTRERLKKLGCMEDTFDSVICRLLDEHIELEEMKKKK